MLTNRSMPRATVIPQLGYPDVVAAAEWLERCFGFTLRLRIADHRIHMNVGAVVLTRSDNAPKGSVMVRVADVDAHHAAATAAGVTSEAPQTFAYGERQYGAVDCGGHAWTFSQSVADVAPEDWGGTAGKL